MKVSEEPAGSKLQGISSSLNMEQEDSCDLLLAIYQTTYFALLYTLTSVPRSDEAGRMSCRAVPRSPSCNAESKTLWLESP
jgi:hypothetical protein